MVLAYTEQVLVPTLRPGDVAKLASTYAAVISLADIVAWWYESWL